MKVINNNKLFGLAGISVAVLLLSGCASQSEQVEGLQAELRASARALEYCRARVEEADERVQRAQARTEEFRLRTEELERRMARMEARMTSKG